MKPGRVVVAALLVPAAVVMIGAAVHAKPVDEIGHRPPAVHLVQGQQAAAPGGKAAHSHTVARMLGGRMVRHVIPHPYLLHRPYVFRIFRRRY